MCEPGGHGRPSFRAVFSNWQEYDGSFGEKLALTARNWWIRIRHMQSCCGNPGQPGC